ncbi:uncharacterized protein PHALS_15403 [Plasmopara halstedii]|uniref:Uncharacterized protein n=1 Tax=Plasmopara halstedii TaxID=4781 RepID=A0A0N7L4V6_PLAHL|nr:uncharacterized protein PHALS_15403 [Plasmopara halstedii]CEG39739.1 hypothetical protein PHALS_15403 [Plasmopara halstedii]|eukprot:XP_024576108.1 hypothetical protein PHALS_15403 [Plasmopara halstedii]
MLSLAKSISFIMFNGVSISSFLTESQLVNVKMYKLHSIEVSSVLKTSMGMVRVGLNAKSGAGRNDKITS